MRIILLETDCSTFLLRADDGRTIIVDADFLGVAETFGWSPPAGVMADPTGNLEEDLSAVIREACDFLHERAGSTADDPGYV